MVDSFFGFGAYGTPKKNSMLKNGAVQFTPGGPPRVINTKKGEATVVAHREYIGDLMSGTFVPTTTSTAYECLSYSLNPGNSQLFPWLSTVASNFQEWELQGALVELITEAADFSSNFSIGNVMMAADYNPLAPMPQNKIDLLELEYSSSTKASNSLLMPIECARVNNSLTHLFVAEDSDYQGTDARSFDLATIHIGTQGIPVEEAKLAEIWITYEVALYKPTLKDAFFEGGTAAHIQVFGCSSSLNLGVNGTALIMPGSSDGFSVVNNVITLPDGNENWLVLCQWAGGTWTNLTQPTLTLQGLAVLPNMWSNQAGNGQLGSTDPGTGLTGSGKMATMVNVASIEPYIGNRFITFTGGTFPGTTCFGDIYIIRLPRGLVY
jgi:hypothetical protein